MSWELVCQAERVGDGVKARVAPQLDGPDTTAFGLLADFINAVTD